MLGLVICLILAVQAIVLIKLWSAQRNLARETYIRRFPFPKGLFAKVIQRHPHLSLKDMELVSHGLRQFFLAYLKSGKRYVSMPSQVADDLWHEFILYTKNYQEFNRQAFGGFLHHTPAAVLKRGNAQIDIGLRRCWRYACQEENINPRRASRLPLLFALDSKFNIANGFYYQANCSGVRAANTGGADVIYCGSDFADNGLFGGDAGFDDSGSTSHHSADTASSDSDSGGDADGGGGDGCGGGCGGD